MNLDGEVIYLLLNVNNRRIWKRKWLQRSWIWQRNPWFYRYQAAWCAIRRMSIWTNGTATWLISSRTEWSLLLTAGNLEHLIRFSAKSLLLRGCKLRNTEFLIGLVVYNGPESKIMMNAKKPPTKISNIQRKMN